MNTVKNLIQQSIIITCLVIFISGCTPPKEAKIHQMDHNGNHLKAMSIHHDVLDGNNVLILRNHHKGQSYKVLESPHSIKNYGLTDDTKYLLYISNKSGQNEFFIQQLHTGVRIKADVVTDVKGIFISGNNYLGYTSPKDKIELTYSNLEAFIKETEIRCLEQRRMKRPCTVETMPK